MSILLADIPSTTAPVVAQPVPLHPTTAGGQSEIAGSFGVIIWFLWMGIGVGLARVLGVFRRGSVAGPDRLLEPRAAWDLLFVLCGTFFLAAFITVKTLHAAHSTSAVVTLQADILGKGVSIVVLVAAVKYWKTTRQARIGLDARRIAPGLVAGMATIFILFPLILLTSVAVDFVIRHLSLHQAEPHPLLQTLGATHSRKVKLLAVIVAVVLAPIQEEILFRGLLQTSLVRFFSWISFEAQSSLPSSAIDEPVVPSRFRPPARWAAICITAMGFGAIHDQPAFFAPLFVLAVGLGYAYERTGNLWITVTAHAVFNAVQISLFLEMRA